MSQSLSRGGGLRHYLSPTYNAVLSSLSNKNSHQDSPNPSNQHEGWFDQQPTSGPNDSETQSSHVSDYNDTPTQSLKACQLLYS